MITRRATPFDSLYRHDFVRTAVCVPELRVAAPRHNAEATVALARKASADGAILAVFPELGLAGYSSEDLFHQDALLDGVTDALETVLSASSDLDSMLLVGAPLRLEQRLYNTAVVMHRGHILGVVPKTYLPNYREFYEKRQFTSGAAALTDEIRLLGQRVPFGSRLIFRAADLDDFALHVELCEDVWVPVPPSAYAALAGATVLANLSASNITIGKAEYRHALCAGQSAKCVAAYLYAAAGPGESTTDLAWDGQALIYEDGNCLAESPRFSAESTWITADVDLARLRQERTRMTSFNDCVREHRERLSGFRQVRVELGVPRARVPLRREIQRFPYVPATRERWGERCYEAYNIQVAGLAQRLQATGIERAVIGISGGLDSTHALIVTCRAMDRLGLPRANILAYTMPGFATSSKTLTNARRLMEALGVTAGEIDIRPSSRQMLTDIGHPAAEGEQRYDTTFENVQAGERTSHLFRLANRHGGLVVGTGDLSELALGWTTYGVGDQMSHYNVNASVPKTLIQHLIRWVIQTGELNEAAGEVLESILATEISPELIPGDDDTDPDAPAQRTEDVIGPYELHDFFLYYISRFGYRPSKVVFLAEHAWGDANAGRWPAHYPADERRAYHRSQIKHWLRVFLQRFFGFSQFKRSAMPNAPKVGSGGSLSPRSDWRAPSDTGADAWLEELQRNVPD